MKTQVGWAIVGVLLAAQGALAADLPFLERFALAEDRAEVLKELVPGTEDYYYFTCLYHQENSDFDAVDGLLETWIGRHGRTGQVQEIQHRQALLRYGSAPDDTLAYLKSHFGLRFDHERQIPGKAPDLPMALFPDLISRETLLKRALADPGNQETVDGFRPHAYPWLLAADLNQNQLRSLLGLLELPDYPRLPERIAEDLDAPRSGGFGSLTIHRLLLREQLDTLLHLKPELLDNDAFIETYLRRLLPGNDDPNWRRDPALMDAYLDRLWDFVQRLAPAQTSLKAHVLFQRLVFDQSQGVHDPDRFLQYIKIPRRMDYVNPAILAEGINGRFAADLARDYGAGTGLGPIHSDEALVTQYLRHFFANGADYRTYAPYIREGYLRQLFAEVKLLQGAGDMEQWYAWLDPAAVDALRNRVDLAFDPGNRQDFGLEEAVTLDVHVKNVDRLLVKVFEIDTKNYYQQFNRPINTAIDLDGLVANHEQVYTYNEAPLRQVRRQYTFPELSGRGVWVIEFVGNGTSSRAVVAKGGLQYLSRTGPAGQLFTVFDERGSQLRDASIWFAGRSYAADDNGDITLPFSTDPGERSLLLCDGDFAVLSRFQQQGEEYRLAAGFHVDGESLRAGETATVAVRPALYLNGTPMPLSLLKSPVLRIRSSTHDGIESSQEVTDITLQNDGLTVQAFRVPENLQQLMLSLSGSVDPLTGSEPVTLHGNENIFANAIHSLQQTGGILLTESEHGYALEYRDKSGNPVRDRAVRVTLQPVDFAESVDVMLKTDARGRITLGALPDIQGIMTRSDGLERQSWTLRKPAFTVPPQLHGAADEPIRLPFPGDAPGRVADAASLLEVRHGAYVADHTDRLALEDGYLTLSGLAAGDYLLHLRDSGQKVAVRVTAGDGPGSYIASDARLLQATSMTPLQIQSVETNGDALEIRVGGANTYTRVHVVANRFLPDNNLYRQLDVTASPRADVRTTDQGFALYTSGRQIGDEYRYILERRFSARFPGNMLERPSLLLNPWALEETQASQEAAAMGEAPASMPAPAPSPAASEPPAENVNVERRGTYIPYSPDFRFLDGDAAALYNLEPDENGVVTVPLAELHGRTSLQIVATDPLVTVSRYKVLPAEDWAPRDLRLAKALDPEGHVVERKRVQVLEAGDVLKVSLTGDADVQIYDSVPKVLGLFMTLNESPDLKAFSFAGRWPSLSAEEKREKFSEFASHELNFFLYHKDREFFDAVVRPYLANKYQKTFLDHWLLEADLGAYLDPWRFGQLNVVEKVLLARRVADVQPRVTRHLGDALEMIPPDPERENRLFMTALYGGALGGGATAVGEELDSLGYHMNQMGDGIAGFGGGGGGFGGGRPGLGAAGNGIHDRRSGDDAAVVAEMEAKSSPKPEPQLKRKITAGQEVPLVAGKRQRAERDEGAVTHFFSGVDPSTVRENYRALFRAPEKTQALVETDYYKLPIEQAHSEMIPLNAFWLDYAKATPGAPFRSEYIAGAASSVAEAMLALAVIDLPFDAPQHQAETTGGAFTLQAGGAGIAFYKDIDAATAAGDTAPVLVSQNYFRLDDRYRYEGNQQFDKFVTDEFLTGVVYGCQVTVTNPTSTPRQIEVLRQIPAGSLPVAGGRYTWSTRMALGAYNTTLQEYYFYFPEAGTFAHYPVHVSEEGDLIASAEARALKAVAVASTVDTTAWSYIAQQASNDEVIAFLETANLYRLELREILWRMKDETFYRQVIELLNERAYFASELWSYAIHHNDAKALTTYLQYRPDFVFETGPCLESPLLTIDPVETNLYQHIEYAPLINPRAHHLEGKWMITNEQLKVQYTALMHVIAHRPGLRPEDLLALTYYLVLQDRVGEALEYFARLAPDELPARIQYDYLQAYLGFYQEDPATAARIAAQYEAHPVERWRTRFAEVAAQAAEIAGATTAGGGTTATQDALAATEPQLDLEVDDGGLTIYYRNLAACDISYYPVDLEMLFTRSPFTLAGTDVIAGVKPMATHTIALDPGQTRMAVPLPMEFAASHVVVKVEAAGISRTDIRYASRLVAQLVERYGQIQVNGKSDNKPLPKVYVKVFAQGHDGSTLFYRDGYTDLRGRFDYASSSTLDIGDVARFAILVLSEEEGAKVLTASPPAQ